MGLRVPSLPSGCLMVHLSIVVLRWKYEAPRVVRVYLYSSNILSKNSFICKMLLG